MYSNSDADTSSVPRRLLLPLRGARHPEVRVSGAARQCVEIPIYSDPLFRVTLLLYGDAQHTGTLAASGERSQ